MKKILVATDASEYSREALKSALELARNSQSEVELLYAMYHPIVYEQDVLPQTEQSGEMVIKLTLEGIDISGVNLTKKVVQGKPANMILEEIEKETIDLVVMGSHGYGRIVGALIGSVSQRVLHGATCSVLIVK